MNEHDVQQLVQHEYAQTSIRIKARQLCRRSDFRRSECEDVQQELWLHLLTQARNFDPKRSALDTFIDRMVNCAAALLIRRREGDTRADGNYTQSLDTGTKVQDQHNESLGSTLTLDDDARRRGLVPQNDLAAFEDREAVAHALASMPPAVRDVCQRMMDGATPTALARESGISRRQFSKLLVEAREYLERAGFGNE